MNKFIILLLLFVSLGYSQAIRPNSIKNYMIQDGQIDSSKVNAGFKSYVEYQGNFGSKIQNTLTKLRTGDVRFGSSDTVRFVILTDSRNGWIDPFFAELKAAYPNVPITYDNLANGGYNVANNFALMFEDAVIHQNPDCFIWGEHEADYHLYFALNYHLLRKIRENTTSDIVFINSNPQKPYYGNWRNHEYDPERDVARKLNAEFVDVFARWKRMYDASIDMTQYYNPNQDTHPNTDGYQIYVDELMAHFDTSAVRSRLYNPNPMDNTEDILELEEASMWHDSSDFKPYGNWTVQTTPPDSFSGYALKSTTQNDSIIVPFLGTGFQLYYNNSASGGNVSFTIDDVNPASILINKRPLQYATTPLPDAANHTQSGYATARPLKVIVNAPVTPGTYTITITDTTSGTTSFSVTDPSSTNIGNGNYTTDYTSTNGEISIPVQYAGKNTWFNSTIFYPNDKFYFTIRNNYVSSVSMNGTANESKALRIFGLENKGHVLKITHTDTNPVLLDALKIYHPIGGRKVNAFSKYNTFTSFSQGTAYSAEATALFARMSPAPSAARKAAINTFIVNLKSAGVWALADDIGFLAADVPANALLNWKSTSFTPTLVNSPAYVADRGYTGNGLTGGSAAYVKLNYIPSTDAVNNTLNNSSHFIYIRATVDENLEDFGALYNSKASMLKTHYSASYMAVDVNDYGNYNTNNAALTSGGFLGLFGARRNNSTTVDILYNGSNIQSALGAPSVALPTLTLAICGITRATPVASTKQACFWFIGGYLNDSQHATLKTEVERYLDYLGAGVLP